jgi:hypothetical protein
MFEYGKTGIASRNSCDFDPDPGAVILASCALRSRQTVKVRYPPGQFGSGTYRTVGRGLGGVDTAGAAAVVGESSVFAGAVMFDGVVADELFTDGDLEVIADDGDLDLAASELVANAVVGAGEADVAQRVDLSGDRYC